MKLSISNISWDAENDTTVYGLMKKYGYFGLEIAPTRIFPENPYDKLYDAKVWAEELKDTQGFVVTSMQSIWYGRQEKIFGTNEERQFLIDYTKKAVDFAEIIGCRNLVFGCPRNRNLTENADVSVAISFFKILGDYALEHNTVIGMEANPPIYNTNYINDTSAALRLIEQVDSEGFKLNLDVGTMIENGEKLDELIGKVNYINHVHISEPGLKRIEERSFHEELRRVLDKENYHGYISIEMSKREKVAEIEQTLEYVKNIFELENSGV